MITSEYVFAGAVSGLAALRESLWFSFPEVSQAVGAIVVAAIWQGAIIAGCLAICLKLTQRISAKLRFSVWIAGFLAVAGLPFLPMILRLWAGRGPALDTGATSSGPFLQLDLRWSTLIAVLWIATSVYRALDLAVHSIRLRKLWQTAMPVVAGADPLTAPARLWGRKPIEICTTDSLDRPSVIGFWAPRILIPDWLLPRLSQGELDQIVLHETEHLRRGDDWTNLLQKLSLVLFPLNPVLLWMERQLCLEREMACDEAVIHRTHAPKAYATCLTNLAERGLERRAEAVSLGALSLGAWQRRPELVQRIQSILVRKPALGPIGARSVVAALSCGLVFGSVELARCPQLVVFAPAERTQSARFDGPAPRMRSPEFRSVPVSASTRSSTGMGGLRMTELKAVMPVRSGNAWTKPIPSRPALPSTTQKLASEPSPSTLADAPPPPEPVTAEFTAPAATEEQSWIVLTTWEEVEVANQDSAQMAAGTDTHGNGASNRAPTGASGQFTVTRLILRVLPAGSKSTSPASLPIRGGWLVIQL